MSVSGRFCEEHLPLFLTIMEKSPDHIIRSNMVIAFGDIVQSYSRLVDPHISHLFARLQDPSMLVKRNALMVLTHLALTGMIKVRGQIGEIARCIEDEDVQVRDLAKLFFAELAGRDSANSIYNYLPDIITSLSVAMVGEPDKLARILKFVLGFIKKDRQLETLVEKLCLRLRQLDNLEQQRATANCLLVLPITTDRAIVKLIEGFSFYQDKLVDTAIGHCFLEICSRIKKMSTLKPEIKEQVDSWERRLLASVCDGVANKAKPAALNADMDDRDENADNAMNDYKPQHKTSHRTTARRAVK